MPKRGNSKRNQAAASRAGARGKGAQQLPPDMQDEIDLFHQSKDKLAFNSDDSEVDMDDKLEDEAVLDIEAAADDEPDDLDSEDEIEAALARGGRDAELAKQAKALRQRLRVQQGEDSDDAAAEDDDGDQQLWGKKRRVYYGADEEGATDEDEEAEEAEALRLKQEAAAQLGEEDYALLSSEGEEGVEEHTMGTAAKKAAAGVERINRDGADVAAQREAVLRAAPELEALAKELTDCMRELRSKVGPLMQEVQSGGLVTEQGVSYLEAKHLLLLQYCMHIVFYLLLKAEGRPVQDHPVIAKLVQIRSYLDKIRPIDKRLAYQLERLLQAARTVRDNAAAPDTPAPRDAPTARTEDPRAFAPNPDALMPAHGAAVHSGDGEGPSGTGAAANGVYRPPRINPTAMDDDPDRPADAKKERRAAHLRHKAMRSEMVRELMAEVEEAPEELGARGVGTLTSGAAVREAQRRNKITEVEEELMTRIVLSKEERARLKSLGHDRRTAASGALLDGFDELADLVEVGQAELDKAMQRPGRGLALGNLSQTYGVDLSGFAKQNVRGGDDDLPARPSLATRRAKTDALRARQAAADSEDDEGAPTLVGKRSRGEEDEFYQASVAAAAAKKAARRQAFKRADLAPPLGDPTTSGARKIDRTIEKNRGLTPHRRRDLKNPRKKNRVKFAKAEVRRKGQVQGVREAPGAGYGGEATGINARVSKSVRF